MLKRLFQRAILACPDVRGKTWLLRRIGRTQYEVADAGPMMLSPVHLIERYIVQTGSYAPALIAEIKHALRDGGDFVDVGANIGYMSLVASRASSAGTVYAFEPSPREFKTLIENVGLSSARNVTLFPIALGSEPKTGTLYLHGLENPGMNSRHGTGTPTGIRIERFVDVIPTPMISRIRCIKIDVEGDELEVLKGMEPVMDGLNATFIVEVARSENVADIYTFFERYGFSPKYGPSPDLLDEIFTRGS